MISACYDIDDFFRTIEGKTIQEIVYLADREALDAWRAGHRLKKTSGGDIHKVIEYERDLIDLISYLRSSIKPSTPSSDRERRFDAIYQRLLETRPGISSVAGDCFFFV